MANKRYISFIDQGVEVWNSYMMVLTREFRSSFNNKIDLTRIDLSGRILRGIMLSHVNLTGAKLSNSDLFGAKFMDSNLTGANLTDADLTNADFTGADLTNANLTGADLTNTNLFRVKLDGAILSYARFQNTFLSKSWKRYLKDSGAREIEQAQWVEDFMDILTKSRKNTLHINIDPGSATPKEIGEFLAEFSKLYRMIGGSGLTFESFGVSQVVEGANE